MPSLDGGWNDLLIPLVLGALAALLVVLVVMAILRAGALRRRLLPILVLAVGSIGIIAILDRLAQDDRNAERRALAQRSAQLTAWALAPGSGLACLDDVAGETVENACERAVFAGPQATASAVAYTAARLSLLADALAFARRSDPAFAATLGGLRRAVELDRFGLAAHVLALRDGCTADRCAAFAWLGDANPIKSNMKAQLFDQYVSRHAVDWNKAVPVAEQRAPVANAPEAPAMGTPVPSKYDFPSAASIPPVSIMSAEPPLPKGAAEAQASQNPAAKGTPVPAPPKRPPPEATAPGAR